MPRKQSIRFLNRSELDTGRWDECMLRSPNGLVYGTSQFLDAMCDDWCALVKGEYEAVMPLPFRRKFGVHYLYQPAFCQQLGIFSVAPLDVGITAMFLESIPHRFRFWDIPLNAANAVSGIPFRLRPNYLLSLDLPYETLRSGYSRSARRNIARAEKLGMQLKENISPHDIISLHRRRFQKQSGVDDRAYRRLETLLHLLIPQLRACCVAACLANGNLMATSAYLFYKNRMIFLLNGNPAEGLATGASHFLKDAMIRRFAGSDLWMDFEGSETPRFARFFEQFGGQALEQYPAITVNRLPWPFRLLK